MILKGIAKKLRCESIELNSSDSGCSPLAESYEHDNSVTLGVVQKACNFETSLTASSEILCFMPLATYDWGGRYFKNI